MAFWMCPACGRKVPGYSTACHCGTSREAATHLAAGDPRRTPGSGPVRFEWADVPRPAWVALGIIVLALLAGLWSLFRPLPPNNIPPLLGYREHSAQRPAAPAPGSAATTPGPVRPSDRPIVILTPMPLTDTRK